MKKSKLVLVCSFLCLIGIFTTEAQVKFEVPQNVELKGKEDYANYESAIIDAANWLEQTDLNKELEKRQQVNSFVIQWVTGSPTVSVDLIPQLGKLYGKNTQLLALYLAVYSREFIENKSTATNFSATKTGIISMMNVYQKGIDIKKSKEMEKFIKYREEGTIDTYIKMYFPATSK